MSIGPKTNAAWSNKEDGYVFKPEHVGPMVNVADLPREQQEAIVGKPLADALAEIKGFVPGHYEITSVRQSARETLGDEWDGIDLQD